MLKLFAFVTFSTVGLLACGGAALPSQSPEARAVTLSDNQPPAAYVALGPVTAQSGKGCGFVGELGSREGVERNLRDAAAQLGATYVVITSRKAPGPNHQCLEHEYKLEGRAYRRAAAPSPPVAPVSVSPPVAPVSVPPPAPAAVVRVCVPGATQACLGPGACQGAQACRDDASGFQACDCGPAPKN